MKHEKVNSMTGRGCHHADDSRSVADTKEKPINKDRKLIEGTWKAVALVVDGNRTSEDDAEKITVVNGGDEIRTLLQEGNEISEGTSTIDPTRKPKSLNFKPTDGED